MNVPAIKNKQGFTIIEVVLVLAIAALIFLMVFIALPALQRNQRDTARKTVIGKVASAVTSFQSNNRGNSPSTTPATFQTQFRNYIDGTAQAGTAGIPDGISMDNGEYHVIIRQMVNTGTPPTAAFQFDTNQRITGTGSPTPAANVDAQVVEIVTRARCDANGSGVVFANRRDVAVLIGLENGRASLCQNV